MKRLDASPESSSDVWASVCPPPSDGKLPKRKQIYSKEFQEMLDKLDTEEKEEEEEERFGGIGGGEKKGRLGIHQVKALERSFEKENKLEPKRKNRLAEDLGLQPRQVAIWFQNRRARRKTKQLERDYGSLKSDYDSLRADYDSLEQDNKFLLSQLMELKMKLQQRVRAAENNLDCECHVVAKEEYPVSELAIVKPQFSYVSDSDDSLVKESEGEDDLNLLKAEADAVMPMCSPTVGFESWEGSVRTPAVGDDDEGYSGGGAAAAAGLAQLLLGRSSHGRCIATSQRTMISSHGTERGPEYRLIKSNGSRLKIDGVLQ